MKKGKPGAGNSKLALRSTRVLVGGALRPATVVIEGEHVVAVLPYDQPAEDVEDRGDLVIMPALVDTHVHVNEPGRSDWEGFRTATAAAAAGGAAVIVDMPLNSVPPTTTVAALEEKRAAATGSCYIDVGFWGGIVPGSLDQVGPLTDAGVFGFKCFLVPSGVDEFPPIDPDDLEAVLAATGEHRVPLLVHAESPDVIAAAPEPAEDYPSYLASRPPDAEVEAVGAVVAAVGRTGSPAHVLHLSAVEALGPIAAGRERSLPVTTETCPHYLALCAEEVPDADFSWKCAPPIRSADNREGLWAALGSGLIDMVVSDHSPCPGDLKAGGFARAWGGIASLELRLPVTWTEARRRGHGIEDLARWLCTVPAGFIGLPSGSVAAGNRADLVVWDPEAEFVVDPSALHQRHPSTPYAGRRLSGVVRSTLVRGRMVYRDGVLEPEPGGHLLRRRPERPQE